MVELAGHVRRSGMTAHHTRHQPLLCREHHTRGRLRLGPCFSVLVGTPEVERAFLPFHVVVLHAPREVRCPHHPWERLQPNDRADTLWLGCGSITFGAPASLMPPRTGHSDPTSSRTRRRSLTLVSRLGAATLRLERPVPRRS